MNPFLLNRNMVQGMDGRMIVDAEAQASMDFPPPDDESDDELPPPAFIPHPQAAVVDSIPPSNSHGISETKCALEREAKCALVKRTVHSSEAKCALHLQY